MEVVMAFVIGILVAGSVYLLLSRNVLRAVFGVILLSNAVNLVILTVGGLSLGLPPLIGPEAKVLAEPYSNPLPQALILTAIVIGFGLLSFALALVYRAYQELGTLDSDGMRVAEPPEAGPAADAGEMADARRREAA
ncbi:Na+/H+ antiporter subunit C [Rhodocista pekingensis]|uniref:Na+/H+ antiporter subunit C n=1 Tax=Rhodocista pekingensis TaxID=201185 RepID=A0ABW2KYF0_9PROT